VGRFNVIEGEVKMKKLAIFLMVIAILGFSCAIIALARTEIEGTSYVRMNTSSIINGETVSRGINRMDYKWTYNYRTGEIVREISRAGSRGTVAFYAPRA
jgi:hypothetical protein